MVQQVHLGEYLHRDITLSVDYLFLVGAHAGQESYRCTTQGAPHGNLVSAAWIPDPGILVPTEKIPPEIAILHIHGASRQKTNGQTGQTDNRSSLGRLPAVVHHFLYVCQRKIAPFRTFR